MLSSKPANTGVAVTAATGELDIVWVASACGDAQPVMLTRRKNNGKAVKDLRITVQVSRLAAGWGYRLALMMALGCASALS